MSINIPKQGKPISKVLPTAILIALTLIAAVAVAGFVFGLFGSAQVNVLDISCGKGSSDLRCSFDLRNTGTTNAAVTAVSMKIGGVPSATTCSPSLPQTIPAGGTLSGVICTSNIANADEPAVGSTATGIISLSNGGSVQFSGVWA